jgi:DNA-binding SARP family transcriptional activator
VWPVPPLRVPADGSQVGPASVGEYAALGLFAERARSVVPSFRISADNVAEVVLTCRRLEGIPLAIELAAARMRVLGARELASGMDDVFALLVGTTRDGPARHHTLRATLDWSHELLTAKEQALFRRICVFPGGFDLPAAIAVGAGPEVSGPEILDLLARLVDKSLVQVNHHDGAARYRMLATVRQYGRQRLPVGERRTLWRSHLDHFTAVAERAEPLLTGADGPAQMDRMELEGNNFRAALQFARDSGDVVAGLRLATALWPLCYLRGHYREGREWLDWAITNGVGAPDLLRAKALQGSGTLSFLQCDYAVALLRLEEAIALYRHLGDARGTAEVLLTLGSVAREQGRYVAAIRLYTESRALSEAGGDVRGAARADNYLGFVAWLHGDFSGAGRRSGLTLKLFRGLGDAEGVAWSLINQGTVAQYQGELARASSLLAASLQQSREAGFQEGIAWSLHELGIVALRQRDHHRATALLREALDRHRDLGDRWRASSVVEDLAAAAALGGEPTTAAALLGAADTLRGAIGTALAPCEEPDHERTGALLAAQLGEAALADAREVGRSGSLDDLLHQATAAGGARREEVAQARHTAASSSPGRSDVLGPEALRIHALGHGSVRVGDRVLEAADWSYAKPRELLYLLLGSPPQTKEQLGVALWPELSDHQLRNALHTALRELRRALGAPGWVRYESGRYAFTSIGECHYDVREFERATQEANGLSGPSALPHLRRAVSLYTGEYLADVPAGDWAQERRGRLRELYTGALLGYGRSLSAEGQVRQAVEVLRRAVDEDPLDERAHRALMTCWALAGEPARAVRHYGQLAQRLREELGVAPSERTKDLVRRLRPSSAPPR